MICPQHINKPILMICLAPHTCQCSRKLCIECITEHGVDVKYLVSNERFQEMLKEKLQKFQDQETQTIGKQKQKLKNLHSKIKRSMKEHLMDFSASLKKIYQAIDSQNQLFLNLIHECDNLSESSQTDLEQLVSILEGTPLENWNKAKNSYLIKLENVKQWWKLENNVWMKKQKKYQKEIDSLIKSVNQKEVYEQKKEFYDALASLKDIDVKIFNIIIEKALNAKISDILVFLSNEQNQKLLEWQPDKQRDINLGRNNINKIINAIRNIKEHEFNQNNYSTEIHFITKKNLIQKISQDQIIIEFLKFLVHLTAIDNQFIQCGSNSLHILVDMKVDLTQQCFSNIRIKNTSLIGANLVRCNFNGSEFDNVDISGMNLNGAQLLNCKWKNLRIQESHDLDSHSNQVLSACFSPDGTTLASSSEDFSICLWNVQTGQLKFQLDGHTSAVLSLCYSPDGTTIAFGSADNFICLKDAKTGQQKFHLDGHASAVISLCFSPDNATLASGSIDKSIRLWDVKTGQQRAQLIGHSNSVLSVCFSPDNATLASGSEDQSIRLWDVKTGRQRKKLNGHSNSVLSVCFSPDNATLASCSWDSIFIWSFETGKSQTQFNGHSKDIQSICFSPNGATLASGSSDKSIFLWDVKTGQVKAKLVGHTSTVYSVCFSPDGTRLASCSEDKSIRLWDVQASEEILSYKSYKDILAQFKTPQFQINPLLEAYTFITILLISKSPIFQAQGALVYKGEFTNQKGVNLISFLKSKRSFILENQFDLNSKQV
ncbi:unnamed protein product [Paramecium pentaurelia]|uniref:EML-like first beta-propeller domain-containing protein n=1 Tax=Paramecium pentaurelia TaxID=43138 RepID=A0A8S1VUH1_9CILI|nr:unnamed protein product [Paramecium pentaurelia]